MKDWMIRAIKTFVQAFFGVLIPAIVTMLQDGWPESWNKVWVLLAPTLAAALAAAISAVWNIILESMRAQDTVVINEDGPAFGPEVPDKDEMRLDWVSPYDGNTKENDAEAKEE